MSSLLNRPNETEKPRLRGLIHLIMSPVSLVAGLVLVALADKLRGRIALGIFTLAAVTLFTGSALYHRVGWKPKTKEVWRRIDHANITILIAGTYTPFAIFLLDKTQAIVLLSIVWGGAIATRSCGFSGSTLHGGSMSPSTSSWVGLRSSFFQLSGATVGSRSSY